jgi:hypothetical protein
MTRLLPSSAAEAERQRKMSTVFLQHEPTRLEVAQRLERANKRRTATRMGWKNRLVSASAGGLIGLALSGTAFGWGVATGRISLSAAPQTSIPSTQRPDPTPQRGKADPRGAPEGHDSPDFESTQSTQSTESNAPNREHTALPEEASKRYPPSPEKTRRLPSGRKPHEASPGPHRKLLEPTAELPNGAWKNVAAALREDDEQKATEELDRLALGQAQEDRQAARILLLQLRFKSADESSRSLTRSEREWLSGIESDGSSPSVRAAASRLLSAASRGQDDQ